MPDKDTAQLEDELSKTVDIRQFDKENSDNFRHYTLDDYLEHLLVEKKLSKTQVVKDSQLGDYAYNFFAGRKKTSRRNILSLAVAMKLTPTEANHLLYYAGHKKLYVRDQWDHVIWYALENGKDIFDTNELLTDMNLSPLLGDVS